MHQCMQDFLSTPPSHLRNAASTEEGNARCGRKSKYAFLGIHPPNPQNSLAPLVTCTENGGDRGESFIISKRNSTNSLDAIGFSLVSLKCHAHLNSVVNKEVSPFTKTEVKSLWGPSLSHSSSFRRP